MDPRGFQGLYVGPGLAAVQTSFPGCHRVWHTDAKRLKVVSHVKTLQVGTKINSVAPARLPTPVETTAGGSENGRSLEAPGRLMWQGVRSRRQARHESPSRHAAQGDFSHGGPPSVGDTVSFPQSVPTSLGEGTSGREVQGDRFAVEPGEGAVSPPQGLHAVPDEVIPRSRPDIAILLTNLAENSHTGPNPATGQEAWEGSDGPSWMIPSRCNSMRLGVALAWLSLKTSRYKG